MSVCAPHLRRFMAAVEANPTISDEEVEALLDTIPLETLQAEHLELHAQASSREWREYIGLRCRVVKLQTRRLHAEFDKLEATLAEKASRAAKEFRGLQPPAGPHVQLPPPAFAAASLPPPLVWMLPPVGTMAFEQFAALPMAEVPPTLRRAHVGARAVRRLRQGHLRAEYVHWAFCQELSMAMGLE
ncbi:unnamed protein product [Vitrella brassicaformis CCMP3155]|uniref:Uncharacterized protein n=1 Tax=Vitrella brassicaformis (strain CCMP3155) TaxID=1169540 RepID=A0A0G4EB29_VITBC|nr:unnamed protein product [Vitrella brassicaformis CCMP3155]|eukprot:CEL93154.1 unnamed protein product [Vitrella brassicaformis CCMP3155]